MSGTWQSGWVTGDIVTAAEYKKGAGCVFDSTLGGDAASIDTGAASIPAGYSGLMIVLYARSAIASVADTLSVRFNNDTGNNYDSQRAIFNQSATTYSEALAASSMPIGAIPGASAPASAFGTIEATVGHYAQATNHKSVVAKSAYRMGTTTGNQRLELGGGTWFATAAVISRVTILCPGGSNLKSGSRLSVYVLGA